MVVTQKEFKDAIGQINEAFKQLDKRLKDLDEKVDKASEDKKTTRTKKTT